MMKSSASRLTSHMKQVAKELAKDNDSLSHAQYVARFVDILSRLGLKTLIDDLRDDAQKSRLFDGAEILNCQANTQVVYRIAIGASQWSLHVAKDGPELHIEHHPFRRNREELSHSSLGLFQVMVRWNDREMIGPNNLKDRSWAIARYGTYLSHSLTFMTDEQVGALSRHFGIPYEQDIAPGQQQFTSEIAFLNSHSFKVLRKALRFGTCHLPGIHDWRNGLTMLWAHLVAMSDENFSRADQVIRRYFDLRNSKDIGRRTELLKNYWHRVPDLCKAGEVTDSGLFQLLAERKD